MCVVCQGSFLFCSLLHIRTFVCGAWIPGQPGHRNVIYNHYIHDEFDRITTSNVILEYMKHSLNTLDMLSPFCVLNSLRIYNWPAARKYISCLELNHSFHSSPFTVYDYIQMNTEIHYIYTSRVRVVAQGSLKTKKQHVKSVANNNGNAIHKLLSKPLLYSKGQIRGRYGNNYLSNWHCHQHQHQRHIRMYTTFSNKYSPYFNVCLILNNSIIKNLKIRRS